MFGRLALLLAVLAMTVVTMVTPAHAARMDAHSDHAAMMQHGVADDGHCDHLHDCAAGDARACAAVCAGLAVVPTLPAVQFGQAVIRPRHALPAAAIRDSRAPALQDRPPKPRLL